MSVARAQPHSDGDLSDETEDTPINMIGVAGKRKLALCFFQTLTFSGSLRFPIYFSSGLAGRAFGRKPICRLETVTQ